MVHNQYHVTGKRCASLVGENMAHGCRRCVKADDWGGERRASYHTNMEIPLPYMDGRPLTYIPQSSALISKKNDPRYFF